MEDHTPQSLFIFAFHLQRLFKIRTSLINKIQTSKLSHNLQSPLTIAMQQLKDSVLVVLDIWISRVWKNWWVCKKLLMTPSNYYQTIYLSLSAIHKVFCLQTANLRIFGKTTKRTSTVIYRCGLKEFLDASLLGKLNKTCKSKSLNLIILKFKSLYKQTKATSRIRKSNNLRKKLSQKFSGR